MGKNETKGMDNKEILRAAMRERNMTQMKLADHLGMLQSSVSGNLNRPRMGLDVFIKILDAMDYDVVVVDRASREVMWQVKK